MLALQFHEYGDPDVLRLGQATEPQAKRGQVRIAVRAASVNAYDWKVRAGYLAGTAPARFPAIPGLDAAGIVDQVGEGVDGIAVGDEVFGLGSRTFAELAVLSFATLKPATLSFVEAAALGVSVETAGRCLDLLGVGSGWVVVIDGAAGGVGTAAVQLAVARGATVIGTASAGNHDYLRALGAIPTTYGPGLPERVAALAPGGVEAALDLAGRGSVPELIAITGEAARVASIADYGAGALGALVTDGSAGRAFHALGEAAALHAAGRFVVTIARVFPLAEGAEAHRLAQTGHVRGKVVVTVP